jgi:hypothetical protein
MTEQEYENRKKVLIAENAKGHEFSFGGQRPIDYLKVEIQEVLVTEDAFHWQDKWFNDSGKWKTKREIIDWNKNFILMLGGICGIESGSFVSERQGKYSFISKANLYRLLPSGNKEHVSAEYEFDAEIRAEETILKNEIAYMEYQSELAKGKKPKREISLRFESEAKKRLAVVEMAKFGRQRSDSGAHKRGIMKMLRVPNASADLIGSHWFCFRCIPNFDSQAVRNSYLQGSSDVYSSEPRRIEEQEQQEVIEEQEPSAAFLIGQKISSMKDHKALCKLAKMYLSKGTDLESFMVFVESYLSITKEDRISGIVEYLSKIEEVPAEILTGDPVSQYAYVSGWGNK